jgi:hypothetical protein
MRHSLMIFFNASERRSLFARKAAKPLHLPVLLPTVPDPHVGESNAFALE